jgi:hypothetical protein
VKKAVEHLPELRQKMGAVIDNDLNVQQDILETFVDRGQLRTLAAPTVLPSGKRIPGLKLDHPPQLALMHALVCFAHIPAQQTFTTTELYPKTLAALGVPATNYTLNALRYDLSKLRAKGLVDKRPHSRRYQLRPHGYTISLVFLKLFERVYAPLTAGLLHPFRGDATLPDTNVDKIIPSPRPNKPEQAQIAIDGAEPRHRDLRIDNTFTDEHGDDVKLKKGAQVEVTVTAEPKTSTATINDDR